MHHNKKAFTLVEMLVALAVSAIIVAATYASYELIQKQYKKNIDVIEMHSSGRSIMQVLEREIRMAGYEFRDGNGVMTYGNIIGPLIIKDSGNKCCDEVTIIYDEVMDTLNAQGVVTSSVVDRIKTRFWTEAYSTTKRGSRFRLYKRRTVLGRNNTILATPIVGAREVMADYIEDLQIADSQSQLSLISGTETNGNISVHNLDTKKRTKLFNSGKRVSAIAYDNGIIYATGDGEQKLYSYDLKTGKRLKTLTYPSSYPKFNGMAIDSNGTLFLGSFQNNLIYMVDSKTMLFKASPTFSGGCTKRGVWDIDVGSDGLIYAICYRGSVINVINPSTFGLIKSISTPENTWSVAENGGKIFTSDISTGNVTIFNSSTSKKTGSFKTGRVVTIDINPLTGEIYTGSDGGQNVQIWHGVAPYAKKGSINVGVGDMTLNTKKTGSAAMITIDLTIRSKEQYGKNRQVNKKSYHSGNFIFSMNDSYQRDTFSTTVAVRNL